MRPTTLRTLTAAMLFLAAVTTTQAQSTNEQLNPSSKNGLLLPYVTAADRLRLTGLKAGAVVFQTDSLAGVYYYTGAAWLALARQNVSEVKAVTGPYTGRITTLPDSRSGSAQEAETTFANPYGVAVDAGGTLYVADTYHHRICKISPEGPVTVLAGGTQGYADGLGRAAQFNSPTGVAVDAEGAVFVADAGNNRIRRISPLGAVTTVAGDKQGYLNGNRVVAAFHNPYAVAVAPDGTLYVADTSNNRICRIAPNGTVTSLGSGIKSFDRPTGIALDAAGNVYVADSDHNRICRIDPTGSISILAGGKAGYTDGLVGNARFNHPTGVAVDKAGAVYVTEQGTHRLRIVIPNGLVYTVAGSGQASFADGVGDQAAFSLPAGLTISPTGTLYVADMGNNRIRKVVMP
jgi:sugar lactone lactonase YvrE